ncbi:hypothetical protein KSP40_PGU003272 [Platanthera guangdongensis]|uniref:Uncharacterized protein n=1 Tax=Platanthera guangdongensis TaxID=2320717 RepID=A0ABR2LKD9_9ASPA
MHTDGHVSTQPIRMASSPARAQLARLCLTPIDGLEARAFGGTEANELSSGGDAPIGEDSAAFELGEQKISSWIYFALILGVVLFALETLWINPSTGYGTAFIGVVSSISDSPEHRKTYILWINNLNTWRQCCSHRQLQTPFTDLNRPPPEASFSRASTNNLTPSKSCPPVPTHPASLLPPAKRPPNHHSSRPPSPHYQAATL